MRTEHNIANGFYYLASGDQLIYKGNINNCIILLFVFVDDLRLFMVVAIQIFVTTNGI